jgi:tetratricopeptide (TPR) repeat protein
MRAFPGNQVMDWLDKLTVAGNVKSLLAAIGMLGQAEFSRKVNDHASASPEKENKAYALRMEMNEKIYHEVTTSMEQGLYGRASEAIKEVMKEYPNNPQTFVYLAELANQQGKLASAIHNYRLAVEMEPDYVDKSTPLFLGEDIKDLVKEGAEKLKREKKLKPKDKVVAAALKDVYYLQRRLAGGCE